MTQAANETAFFGLRGKVALVVGGGQGMGESSAVLLAKAGCDVAVVDLLPEVAEHCAAAVRATGHRAIAIAANVLDPAVGAAIVAQTERDLGGLDILVSIVGHPSEASLLDMTIEQWERDQGLNLKYFFLIAQETARSFVRRNVAGAITCISSVSGLQGSPRQGAYGAAKAGLINLVKTMAIEWGPYGIRANAIAPGAIVTPKRPDSDLVRDFFKSTLIPMKRRGEVLDVAKAVLFLSSDLSTYISGHTLNVDGGWMSAFILDKRPQDLAPEA